MNNIGNVVGALRRQTPPEKKYILWAKVIDPLVPDLVVICYWDALANDWLPLSEPKYYWNPVKDLLSIPPSSPVVGDRYIVTAGATGLWDAHDNDIAEFIVDHWEFRTPYEGVSALDLTSKSYFVFSSGVWESAVGGGGSAVGLFSPVANIVALEALDTTASDEWPSRYLIAVESAGIFRLDRTSVATPNGTTIIAASVGNWIKETVRPSDLEVINNSIDDISGDLSLLNDTVDGIITELGDKVEQSDIDDSIDAYDILIKDGVPTDGNTFLKLYNSIVGGFKEHPVANIAARNAYNVTSLPQNVFVTDDGDGNWALYKATTTGVGATYIKISDPDLLNALMTASAIKTAYESNSDTNAFTNALLTKLNSINVALQHTQGTDTATNSNSFSLGDGTNTGNKEIIANKLGATKPKMRWNSTTGFWEFSDDGTAYVTLNLISSAANLTLSNLSNVETSRNNLGLKFPSTDITPFASTMTVSLINGIIPCMYDTRTIRGINTDFQITFTDCNDGAVFDCRLIKNTVNSVEGTLVPPAGFTFQDNQDIITKFRLPAGVVNAVHFLTFKIYDTEIQIVSGVEVLNEQGFSPSDPISQQAATDGLLARPKFGGELYGTDVELGNNTTTSLLGAFILRAYNRQLLNLGQYGAELTGGDNSLTNFCFSCKSLDGSKLLTVYNNKNVAFHLGANSPSFGGGVGVIQYYNVTTAPSSAPSAGCIGYTLAGQPLWLRSDNVTVMAIPATFSAQSLWGNLLGISATPRENPTVNIYDSLYKGLGHYEFGNRDNYPGSYYTQIDTIQVSSINGTGSFTTLLGTPGDAANKIRKATTWVKGQQHIIEGWGVATFVDDNTTTFELKLVITNSGGTTTLCTTGANFGSIVTNKGFYFKVSVTCRGLRSGATMGKLSSQGIFTLVKADGSILNYDMETTADVDFDDTLDNNFDAQVQWVSTVTTNNIKCSDLNMIKR